MLVRFVPLPAYNSIYSTFQSRDRTPYRFLVLEDIVDGSGCAGAAGATGDRSDGSRVGSSHSGQRDRYALVIFVVVFVVVQVQMASLDTQFFSYWLGTTDAGATVLVEPSNNVR